MGVQAGTWSDEATGQNSPTFNQSTIETLEISVRPVSFYAKYEFFLSGAPRVFPYLGANYTTNFIDQKFTRQNGGVTTTSDLTGTSSTVSGIVGVKFALLSHVDLGIEYNHVFGGFDQQFVENGEASTQTVGLDGPMILGKIGFTIDDRFGSSMGRKKGSTRFKGKKAKSRNKFKKGITGGRNRYSRGSKPIFKKKRRR